MIVGTLVLLLIIWSILLVSTGVMAPQQFLASPWDQALTLFTQLTPSAWWWTIGLVFGITILGLFLLAFELRPRSTTDRRLLVKKDELGEVTAALTSIQDLVSRETGHIDGVMESSTNVRESPDGIHLDCRLSVDPAISVSDLGRQVQEQLKVSVEHYLGKTVAGVHINAQVAPLEKQHKKKPSRVR